MTLRSKIIPTLALTLALGAALPAGAQFVNNGAPAGTVTTVAQAADARGDTRVQLEGHIIAHQFDDYYTFKDSTGSMTVEIDRVVFRRQEVTPDTKVRLQGEVERSVRGRYIDVNRLDIIE